MRTSGARSAGARRATREHVRRGEDKRRSAPGVVHGLAVRLVTLAPAKVNLVLRVGPPRPDGYHDVASLMVPLDLADVVDVTVSSRPGGVTCRVRGRPELDGPANLAARAAALVKERFGRAEGTTSAAARTVWYRVRPCASSRSRRRR